MFVRPVPGCAVRDPFTRVLLPEAGADVPPNDFWLRRVLQGDVLPVPEPAASAALPGGRTSSAASGRTSSAAT